MTQPELRVGGRGPKGRPVKACAKCGTPFETSTTGSTVNCPNCRGRATTAGAAQGARGGPKRLAEVPRDMRQHMWEYHNYSPAALNEVAQSGRWAETHKFSHETEREGPFGIVPHTHGDIFKDRRESQ